MTDDEIAGLAQKMASSEAALAALVCPFAVGELLRQRDVKKVDDLTKGELTTLAGVGRLGDPCPRWLRRETMDFHVDHITFQRPIDGSALRVDMVARAWRLQGSIRDEKGVASSGERLMELSPDSLRPRIERERRELPRTSQEDLQTAIDSYELDRRAFFDSLGFTDPVDPGYRGPRP